MQRSGYLAVGLGLVICFGARVRADDKNKELQKILGDWQGRQVLLRTARYTISGTHEPKNRKLPPGTPALLPTRSVLLLDVEHRRHRLESSKPAISSDDAGEPLKDYTLTGTETFDGKEQRGMAEKSGDVKGGGLGIVKGDLVFQRIDQGLEPIFFAHGVVPSVWGDLRPDKWPTVFDSENFEYVGRQSFRGRNCAVVRTEPRAYAEIAFDEFYVDTERQSAIVRHVFYSGNNPTLRTDVDWKQTENGWWPDKWTCTWTWRGKVEEIVSGQLEGFDPNPPVTSGDFTIPALPGVTIVVQEVPAPGSGLDPRYPAEKRYLVSSTGSWQEISAKGFRMIDGKELPPERGRKWLRWMIGVLSVAATAVVCICLLRRRKSAK